MHGPAEIKALYAPGRVERLHGMEGLWEESACFPVNTQRRAAVQLPWQRMVFPKQQNRQGGGIRVSCDTVLLMGRPVREHLGFIISVSCR